MHPITETGELTAGNISLHLNGEVKQHSDIAKLIWNVREIISILSRSIALKRGDLIFTGTPAGVGPIRPGDEVIVRIEGLTELSTRIAERA